MSITRLLLLAGLMVFNLFFAQAQITVDFTADQTEGCGSLQVSFCDNSSSTAGNITSWSWSLGGVNSSTECPGRIFGSPGTYEICLTVTDSDGNTGSKCEDFITIHPLPEPDFVADQPEGCVPHTSTFTYTGTSNNIVEYVWGLDGSTGVVVTDGSAAPDAESTYSLVDEYAISLTVTDENGCENFISKPDVITTFDPPAVLFHAEETFKCEPSFSVNFVNDSIQTNMTYTWDFGNNVTFVGPTPPPVLYSNAGSYTVTLIGTNGATACSDTLVLEDYITIGYVADFSFTPAVGCQDLTVSFTDESVETADSVSWNFGDGSPLSTGANPNHVFENSGFYTVTLTRYIAGCATMKTATTQIEVLALPDVAYNNNNTLGCSLPHTVSFTGVSADAVSWEWDFGDSTTSNLQNPNHVYTEFGNYVVTLTVTNANGCENVLSTTTIEVVETEASLLNNEFSGCVPLNITLEDNSTTVIPLNSWLWEIDTPSGMLTSTDTFPNFNMVDTGCFDVVLTVTNILGCSDSRTFTDVICVGDNPLVNFEASPLQACVEQPVGFSDLSSPFVDFWYWDFGNDEESFQQNPENIYTDTGFYDITLIVSDKGCFGDTTLYDYIEVTEPKSRFRVEQNCSSPLYIELVNTSIGADSFFWDFGVPVMSTDTSSLMNPNFTYPDTGTYVVTLTSFNFSTTCVHEETRLIYIHDPLSVFQISDNEGCAPFTISGLNNSIHALEYKWSGIGMTFSNDSIATPQITFNTPGTYTDIQLRVTDVNGCSDSTIYTDNILVNGIDVDFTPNPIGGCQPFEVTFTDNSTNLFAENILWEWVFEDNVADATGETATHLFENLGQQQVSLTVTDTWGCVENLVVSEAVEVTSPAASFTADSLSCTAFPISFNNTSTGKDLTYMWEFGDGTTSTEENPMHQYNISGEFLPCLTITDLYGCTSNFCTTDTILIADPLANFTLDTAYASCPPLVVNFFNTSENATSYQWDFGDGSGLSDLENPSHVYTIPGIFNVTLVATSTDNCVDTFSVQDLVVLDGPLGNFTYEIDSSCAPMNVTFFAESQGFFKYIWDYGDGSPIDTVLNVNADTTTYTYSTPGAFIPKLGIIDQIGCERILESPEEIFVPELTLGFQGTDTVLCDSNNPITFLNLISSTGNIDSLEWQFEGGLPNATTDFEPTVTFDLPGLYDVTLIAHNSYCSDTLIKSDYVRIGDIPTANFSISDVIGCEPLDVTFTDLTTVINGNITQWHWQFGDGFESFVAAPNHIFQNGSTFETQLTVTTDVGCTDSVTQTITIFAQPDVTLTATNPEICIGETTELLATITSDTTGVTYFWENAPSLSCTNCLNPIANPVDTTTYTFVAVSNEGCETRTEISVDVKPFFAPVITITPDTTICANEVVQLFAEGGTDIFSYQWDDTQAGLTCYSNCSNPIAAPFTTTTYGVTVTTDEGCSSSDQVIVSVIDQAQVFAGDDRTICLGDTAMLTLNPTLGGDPLWLISDGLNCSECFDPVASPQTTTDFVAQLTTAEGCDIIDTVRVNVLTQQNISAGEDRTICNGETTLLNGRFLYPDPSLADSFAWTPVASLDLPTLLNPEAMPTETTTYALNIFSENCVLTDSVIIEVVNQTEVEATGAIVCLGDTAQLNVIGAADNYTWSPAEGLSDPNIANPTVTATEDMIYTLVASLSSCQADTVEVSVVTKDLPRATLSSVYTMLGETPILMEIENTSMDYIYNWSPATGLSCTDCANPTVTLNQNMNYTVEVTDVFTGCSKVLETSVRLQSFCGEDLVGIPNAFTPNGDGINDVLEIKYSSSLIIENYKFQVFDRWGGMLFETDNINEQWDGTVGGKNVAAGVVIYFMEFPCHLDGKMLQKKGDITIHR